MNGDLFPIYWVSEFNQTEVISRMKCLVQNHSGSCMNMCGNRNLPNTTEKVKCYEEYGVDLIDYVDIKCGLNANAN